MNELINIKAINEYLSQKGWTSYKFSQELGLDYSFVFRVLKGEANPGIKFTQKLIKFCNNNDIDIKRFIFLNNCCL